MARFDEMPDKAALNEVLKGIIPSPSELGVRPSSWNAANVYYERVKNEKFYSPKDSDSDDSEEEQEYTSPSAVAFTDTDIPTSSTDYSRPRTVGAGYDPERKTMTVIFRDGTFYNYYEVTPGEWSAFKASLSKGAPWLNRANKSQGSDGLFVGKPRGVADASNISPEVRELLYRVVRTQQVRKTGRLSTNKQEAAVSKRRQTGLKAAATRRANKVNKPNTSASKPKKR